MLLDRSLLTRVYLQGVIRIFLTGFKLWSGLKTASAAWGALMGHVEQAILLGSPKVLSSAKETY